MVTTRSGLSTPEKGVDKQSAHSNRHNGDAAGAEDAVWHKGVAISMWQNSGDADSNWSNFIRSKMPFKALPFGINRYSGKHSVLETCPDTWDRYEEDIELAYKAGCTAFRLSIEWSRIEPRRGEVDGSAVKRYHDILDCLDRYGIIPNATLHHFTHPQWFEDLGGFESEGSVDLFVEWSLRAVDLFGERIKFWATFNEPTCSMFLGWITGMHPPGKILAVVTAGRVLLHTLLSHVAAYKAIKAKRRWRGLEVGLVHHNITFEATGPWPLCSLARYAAWWMNYWWGYDLVHQWMLTGRFEWRVPVLGTWLQHQLPEGKPPCDWFGVNYYTRSVITWYLKPWCMPGERMTDMYYPVYAQGLYASLMQASQYGIPLYITETGIADRSDANRAYMIDTYMQATLRAIKDGADVQGFYYWTLVDNFEWNAGYLMEFGLYAWRPDGSVDRVLKEGAKMLVRYYSTLPNTVAGVRKVAATFASRPDADYEAESETALKEVVRGARRRKPAPALVAAV